jgi:hypothetical protein
MRLIFENNFVDFLNFASRNIISQILRNGDGSHLNNEGNYIKVEDSEIDVISFLPKSKYEKVEDVWNSGRTKIKIGRFVRKFLTDFSVSNFNIDDNTIEGFVNLYKSYFSRDKSKLKVVSGEDILKYYLEDNYHLPNGMRSGTLWNSCMRQNERNKFMRIYAKNTNIKMLVYLEDDGKVRARALLWEGVKDHNDSETEYKFMDRIYYIYDHDVTFFKDWAKENGYLSKWEQNAKSELIFDVDGDPCRKSLYVVLDNSNFKYYPYLDTFKFYDKSKGRFSNSDRYNFDHILIQSNGRCERESESEELFDEEFEEFDEDF